MLIAWFKSGRLNCFSQVVRLQIWEKEWVNDISRCWNKWLMYFMKYALVKHQSDSQLWRVSVLYHTLIIWLGTQFTQHTRKTELYKVCSVYCTLYKAWRMYCTSRAMWIVQGVQFVLNKVWCEYCKCSV